MYRAIIAEGELRCERYQMGEHGVDLFDEDGQMLAFVPYANLEALIDAETYVRDDPSLM